MNLLETRELCYSYSGGKLSLDHVCVNIQKGSVTAVLGPNGAGKSTLFLQLNGVLRPDSGEVLFHGQPLQYTRQGLTQLRRQVGMVFQDPNDQLFSASVRKDVSFGAVNLGLPREEIQRRVELAVEQTGIGDYLDLPTHALSFGQKKRVAIAGVLVMEPEVMVLDEPTAGLDPSGVSEILRLILDIRRQRGMTVLFATHEIDLVPLYCDQVLMMDQGKAVFSGTPVQLFRNKQLLRQHGLRLPRIAHLMEILKERDGIEADTDAATIGQARASIISLLKSDFS